MRRSSIVALVAAAAVLCWIALFERGEPDADADQPVFGVEVEAIDAVRLARPGEPEVRLARDGDGFTVAEGGAEPVPADPVEADQLLQNVATLSFGRTLEAAGATGFGLDPPALTVAVTAGSETLTVAFGDQTPAGGNRYLWFRGAMLVTPVRGFRNLGRSGWDLRDRRVFRGDPVAQGLRVEADGAEAAMTRESGNWVITAPFRFVADPFAAAQLVGNLLDLRMTALADDAEVGEPRLVAQVQLEDATQAVAFGAEQPPGVLAQVAGEPQVFVVAREPVEALMEAARTGMESVRSRRLFGYSVWDVTEARFGEWVFRRGASEDEDASWTVDGQAVDRSAVEDLLYRLNSTDAEAIGGEPDPASPDWTIQIGDETVRIHLGPEQVRAHRDGDQRVLLLPRSEWDEIVELAETATRKTPE